MNRRKDSFDNYIEMILSGEVSEPNQNNNIESDYNDTNVDEELDLFRDIFTNDTMLTVDGIGVKKAKTKNCENYDKDKIYSYCKVLVESSNKQNLYLTGNLILNVGDQVMVPYEQDNKNVIGTVIAVGKGFDCAFHCDVSEMKTVVKLLNKNDNHPKSSFTAKSDSKDDNLVYEDDYIKISLVKWTQKNYLVGGNAKAGTFIFENKYDKRFCIYLKDISVDGFLNQAESFTIALSGRQKELKEIPIVYEEKIPECSKECNTIEFKVCYGTIKDGHNSIHLINKPVIESEIISMKIKI